MSKGYSVGMSKADSRFSRVIDSPVRKSRFNRDQVHKTTFNAGKLVPIFIDEILPGDHYEVDLSFVARMQANISCPLDDVELDFYFFFVPRRLTWSGWQALHGENSSSAWVPERPPATAPVVFSPSSDPLTVQQENMIGDYYGIAPGYRYPALPSIQSVLAEPFIGYGLIWNRWYRDQNYQAPLNLYYVGNIDSETFATAPNRPLLYVNKKHDYFTSCLPNTSKPVASTSAGDPPLILGASSFPAGVPPIPAPLADTAPQNVTQLWNTINSFYPDGSQRGMGADYIQRLRTAWQLTKLLERDARGGTRYVELIKSHFNVDAQDYRLQYPEFLGHFHSYVHKQQIAQTSSTDSVSPQANISAFSLTSNRGSVFKKSFVEHGFLHGFVVARQRKTYQQGVERFWFKHQRFDYYYPELAHITEQPVFQKEIYMLPSAEPSPVFGFQEAWADYRFKPNRVSGEMRSGATNSLDVWHYGDYYTTPPVMSAAFIQDNSDVNIMRTLAVQDQHQFIMDIKVHCVATRCMPAYSIPGFVDHF